MAAAGQAPFVPNAGIVTTTARSHDLLPQGDLNFSVFLSPPLCPYSLSMYEVESVVAFEHSVLLYSLLMTVLLAADDVDAYVCVMRRGLDEAARLREGG